MCSLSHCLEMPASHVQETFSQVFERMHHDGLSFKSISEINFHLRCIPGLKELVIIRRDTLNTFRRFKSPLNLVLLRQFSTHQL